jgi:hypothetical protein
MRVVPVRGALRLALMPVLVFLAFSSSLRAQDVGAEALSFFPPDTQQVAYADLSQLRTLPNYKQLREALFSSEMRSLEGFLQSMGSDPEENVNEVILGWRGSAMSMSDAFGLAEGTFDPAQLQSVAAKGNVPSRDYAGYRLIDYRAGSGTGVFFTYLSSDLAAFGRLNDLEALIDDYAGKQLSLNSNSQFVNWEAELAGSGPQWGITTGAAATKIAAPWLGSTSTSKSPFDLSALLKPVKAVLYTVNWSGDFTAQISIICDNSQNAQTLDRLVTIGQSALAAMSGMSASAQQFISRLQISTDGNRLELQGSGPPQLIGELVGGGR